MLRAQHHVPQHDSAIVEFIMRGIDQCDRPLQGQGAQLIKKMRITDDLTCVTSTKLIPAIRIVTEPFAELGAGCDLFHPQRQRRIFLRNASWPEAINENSRAVFCGGRFIGALGFHVSGADRFHHLFTLHHHRQNRETLDRFSVYQFAANAAGICAALARRRNR